MGDFQLSEFQKKKILRVFTTFFDLNQDGVIEWEDFEMAIEKIRVLHNWSSGGEQHCGAMEALRLMWDGLRSYADANNDNKITEEEWNKMWTECVQPMTVNGLVPEWQQKYMDFMFDVNDTSGDKLIDKNEYTIVYTSYGLSKENCEKAFDTFAQSGTIDRETFSKLWTEYFVSTDPNAAGNYLFGCLD